VLLPCGVPLEACTCPFTRTGPPDPGPPNGLPNLGGGLCNGSGVVVGCTFSEELFFAEGGGCFACDAALTEAALRIGNLAVTGDVDNV